MNEQEIWMNLNNEQYQANRKRSMIASVILTIICLGIAGLLGALGVFIGVPLVHRGITNHTGVLIFLLIIGFLGILFLWFGWRAAKDFFSSAQDKLPGHVDLDKEPWFGSKPWRERRIIYESQWIRSPIVWVGGGLFFIITSIALFMFMMQSFKEGNFLLISFVVIEVVTMGLILGYFYKKKKKFKMSICHLKILPTWIGSHFECMVEIKYSTKMTVLPEGPFEIDLLNGKFIGQGKFRKIKEYWKIKKNVSLDHLLQPGAHTLHMPVRIEIPKEVRLCYGGLDSFWRLQLRAPYPGIDYFGEFFVPIYDKE